MKKFYVLNHRNGRFATKVSRSDIPESVAQEVEANDGSHLATTDGATLQVTEDLEPTGWVADFPEFL